MSAVDELARECELRGFWLELTVSSMLVKGARSPDRWRIRGRVTKVVRDSEPVSGGLDESAARLLARLPERV